jgi:predicted 3-demethylubiquinone-9 3-methyltransferase (glyoxalase superfamily)
MGRIVPCLWFDGNAEEAVRLYTSVFPNSHIGAVSRYGEATSNVSGRPKGSVLTIAFDLDGQEFTALNGGPMFKFNEAISFQVYCQTQQKLDHYWNRLSEGGDPSAQQCGWLKDRFGVSWQIVPKAMAKMVADPDQARSNRVMQALLKMKKLDLRVLQEAYDAKS